ncbi:nucleoside triphosphate pyrophosphohydrolase, partial [Streptomyces sp. NPDC086549]|uniref:nucleoside triphosphate pyrophosphohydrolase n=1 Tax=Streptomyces sp. NPDC086549 TaxID=3365752 RepID=UPI00382EFAEB
MERYSGSGKLVRDGIPQIIREGGAEPVVYTAGPEEYRGRLRDKLGEEVAEFLTADEAAAPGELADVLEAVRALGAAGCVQRSGVRFDLIRGFAPASGWCPHRRTATG